MDWNIPIANEEVAAAYAAFKAYVLGVATHFAGSRLLEALDLASLGPETEIALSNDFSDYFTTVRNVGDLVQSIESGYYSQLSLRLATIQLCTAFEVLFDSIARAYGVTADNEPPVEAPYGAAAPIQLGNKTIRQIRKLHRVLGIDTVLNEDEVLLKLSAIIEVRNCFIHSGGRVPSEGKQVRLSVYGIFSKAGGSVHLKHNHFDDFLHYVLIHVQGFVKFLPETASRPVPPA
ncbi:hypothetical protein DPV79_23585 [Burkholderia reimsis]|uniref:RiboL-PSP-HEPN domain-containing protein n=1 Tax=Burkholderia reimsis TaxID=2234132 RepID=A0A365QSV7_9BURK|nr:hypothetical protein [Burkholderia reimsis]RBB36985.1 hypothetical protein DPV79_23585 [Burkholderia reimsis]